MRTLFRRYLYISLLLLPFPTLAETEVAGIKLPDNYTIGGQQLALNGAGIRSKFFVKVYVGALYLATPTRAAEQAIEQTGPRSMQMIMLYKEVAANKITDGWKEGFENNLDENEFNRVADRLTQFNAWFPTLREGDRVHMDYTPGKGTTLVINDTPLGLIEGADFFTALIKVWLGESPADKQLKKALLGN